MGVAHRDIKLENILLDVNNNIKLCDFGASNTYLPGDKLISTVGTRQYCAPEIVKLEEYDGLKTDIWACGNVLYALLHRGLCF